MAAIATFALKAGVWFRRGRLLIVSPDSLGTACPLSGRNSTYRPVQILEASSNTSLESRTHCVQLSLRQRRCDFFDRCFTRRLVCGKPLATSRLALSEHRGKQSVKLIIVEVPECARKIWRQRVRWRCRDCGLVLRFWFACRQRVWQLLSREQIRLYRWIAAIAHMLVMP